MTEIREYDEDTIYNAVKKIVVSDGFKNYLLKQVDEMATVSDGFTLEEMGFKSIEWSVVDDIVKIYLGFYFKPSDSEFQNVVNERFDDEYDKQQFVNICEYKTDKVAENVKFLVWGAVYNHSVLRVVNGGLDSIVLGDIVDFDVVVEVDNDIDLSNVSF